MDCRILNAVRRLSASTVATAKMMVTLHEIWKAAFSV
jgi:hypothetical protein